MFNFNGNISFNNVTINGQVVNGCGFSIGKPQKFDERKFENGNNIEKITIDTTFVNTTVSVSNSSQIEVHFYGQANVDGNVNFDVHTVNHELSISLKFTGNCCNGDLRLDITVPSKTFRSITARSKSADITLNEGVSVDFLKAKTQSGDLETSATFTNLSVLTLSGDVELYVNARKNICVEISTTSGDVSAEFSNIGYIDLSTSVISGDVKNRHNSTSGYIANVDISTISGDIRIR